MPIPPRVKMFDTSVRPYPYRAARTNLPSWQWSPRDWDVFRASCSDTPRQRARAVEIVTRFRSGEPVATIGKSSANFSYPAPGGRISKQLVYKILAAEDLRDARRMVMFYRERHNLGRPIDLGGIRDEWVDRDVIDEQEEF